MASTAVMALKTHVVRIIYSSGAINQKLSKKHTGPFSLGISMVDILSFRRL
jgi:hypothetical protein